MKIDNETEDDIDYNQTGGGGPDDKELLSDPIEGSLPPLAEVLFSPGGVASYSVRLTVAAAPEICCQVTFDDPATLITVHDLQGCDITVSPQSGSNVTTCTTT